MTNNALNGINQVRIQPKSGQSGNIRGTQPRPADFKKHLTRSISDLDGLKFSDHAAKRLESRNVEMTPEKTQRLLNAVETARGKGAKESLVLLDQLAFVVSVRNKTVITACDMNNLKENVFTKIDSAIFG